jgi:hypothetical protein
MKVGDVIIISKIDGARLMTYCPNAYAFVDKKAKPYIQSIWRVSSVRAIPQNNNNNNII